MMNSGIMTAIAIFAPVERVLVDGVVFSDCVAWENELDAVWVGDVDAEVSVLDGPEVIVAAKAKTSKSLCCHQIAIPSP